MAELAEGARLLSEYGVESSIMGSNPILSAIFFNQFLFISRIINSSHTTFGIVALYGLNQFSSLTYHHNVSYIYPIEKAAFLKNQQFQSKEVEDHDP